MRPRVFRSRPAPETDAVARAKAELDVEDDLRRLAEERRRPAATGPHLSFKHDGRLKPGVTFTAPPSDAKPYFS